MEARIKTTSWDLVVANVLMFHRFPGNVAFGAWCTFGFLGVHLYARGIPGSASAIARLLLEGLLVGLGVSCSLFAVMLLFTLLSSQNAPGVLGDHLFRIEPDGLREMTAANESLSRWNGIVEVRKGARYTFVRVAPGLFHVIPRSGFPSVAEYEAFTQEAVRLWRAAT